MKKLLFFSLFVTLTFAQETTSYSWEDGTGTILGTFCYGSCDGVDDAENVGSTSGISPYNGSRMLTVSDPCIDANPEAYIAWVTNLSVGNEISACFYGYDNTPGTKPSLRIWGNWSSNDDITSYTGSASGNSDYTDGSGWGQVCHTWTVTESEDEGLVIKARVYSEDDDLPQEYFIDLVEVTAPNGAIVNYPGSASGCTDASGCNYNPFATEDDGSCVYPEGSISIYDIQYTLDQGQYCYESLHDQECWTTSGTVTAKDPTYSNFYLQDESSSSYAGIYVYDYSAALPTLGQDITITATVNEFYSLTQLIDGASYSVNSSGNSTDPLNITTGDLTGCMESGEKVESMLIRVNNVIVTTPSNEYGEWYVDDGSGPVMINDKLFDGADWPDPSLGQEYASIIGVVDYAYSEFSILPRTMSDIVLCSTCPVADAGDNQSVSTGVTVILDGSSSYDPNGSIIAYEWTQLSGTAVNLSDEEAAITTFTSPNSDGSLTFKLSVFDNDFNEATDEITISISDPMTIQDIQFTTEQGTYCFETPMAGETVITSGVVTHVTPGDYPNFFLQQPGANSWGGIYVYDTSVNPQVGDELIISATVNEYYSFTQLIDVTSSSIISNGNSVNPILISTGDLGIACSFEGEAYESMLVRVSNVTVEGIDEFGNIQINDGSGPTLMDDYYFDGTWSNPSVGDIYPSIVGVVNYSYSEFKIYPRNEDDFNEEVDCNLGDLNGDGGFNVLDIVILANCILAGDCEIIENGCAGDLNGDGGHNVLDIVTLVNCILADDCGGRVDDASEASLIKKDNQVSFEADGFIGGVQMTLTHGSDFSIKMTDRALFADYLTNGNETRLLVITPETEELFSYNGEFEITEVIVANSQYEVSVDLPLAANFNLSDAYPNPFNPTTTMTLTMPLAGDMKVEVYNLHGQVVSTLLSGHKPANTYSLVWDASNSPSGMYFVKAEFGGITETQKLMLIK